MKTLTNIPYNSRFVNAVACFLAQAERDQKSPPRVEIAKRGALREKILTDLRSSFSHFPCVKFQWMLACFCDMSLTLGAICGKFSVKARQRVPAKESRNPDVNQSCERLTKVAKMTEKNVTRLDPMNTVVHYELLRVAHMLMVKNQNQAYWEGVPYPKRPLGWVRFEVARQVSTFAVPLALLIAAWMTHHLVGLLAAIPVAWFVGFVLDRMLARSISAKLKRDMRIDCGRYEAVMWLSKQMGMAPDEITLPVIYKMAADFRVVHAQLVEQQKRDDAAREARNSRRRRIRAGAAGAAAVAGGVTAADIARGASEPDSYSDGSELFEDHAMPELTYSVNPATGWAMNPGGGTDIMGNPFGSNMNGL